MKAFNSFWFAEKRSKAKEREPGIEVTLMTLSGSGRETFDATRKRRERAWDRGRVDDVIPSARILQREYRKFQLSIC